LEARLHFVPMERDRGIDVDGFPVLIGAAAAQQPNWPDPGPVAESMQILRGRPALVQESECAALKAALAAVQGGAALILQAGDCAELFAESWPPAVRRKLDQLHDLAGRLRVGSGSSVVTIGRIAGQYAKPRSEGRNVGPDGVPVLSYRGDAVNDVSPDPVARIPDPRRLVAAYDNAARTLAEIRQSWASRPAAERVFASHELLLLDYELPLVRAGSHGHFCTSTHFGWIGDRTRDPDMAHIALAESVSNPIGVKLGPSATPAQAAELSRRLNPDGEPGRLTLTVRMGAGLIDQLLPPVISAVAQAGPPVIWICDPMHGNTVRTRTGLKIRSVPAIRDEIAAFVAIMRRHRQPPGGLHLEITPDDVTECVPLEAPAATDVSLPRYRTACDPRLNPAQGAEIVDWFGKLL
jgi:3-deoxy-7-phosphoheptulonate synthase